ncbi:NAD(P)/FAD-dependent oxidoreductase [Paenibacillus sp. FJAT-26967]|uniref:phytoene desaturase family protein n=1 Tax=Paenibacillus sp. FJAT-26967 TaxID=1729690 RepID=UPI000838D7B0|nr:phytoene desaturase family protein [Paenibacillus sp. FJAT-26967]
MNPTTIPAPGADLGKTIIAGGGIGGIMAALFAAKRGHRVQLIEQSTQLGGRLAFEGNGTFHIDQGPTIVLLPDMIREILEEAGVPADKLSMVPCDPLYRIHYEDGTVYTKWRDEEKQLQEIERIFPGEADGFRLYMKEMKIRFEKGRAAFLERSFYRKRDFWTWDNMAELIRMRAYLSVSRDAARFFKDPRLRHAYSFQTLYIGGNPQDTPALYSLVPYSEHAHGIWYVKGGYAGLVSTLHQELLARGVEVTTGVRVDEVLHHRGVVEGVVAGGRKIAADRIVLNGEFPGLHQLNGVPSGKKARKFVPSSGCLLIYLGLNRTYADKDVHQFYFSDEFDGMLKDVFRRKVMPDNRCIYVFNPSLLDDTLAPEGQSVLYMLVPVPSGEHLSWEDAQTLAGGIIEDVERLGFDGLRSAVVWRSVRTPQDSLAGGLYGGGSFGIAPTLLQSGVFRPQVKPFGIRGLYAVGASVHPGGGIPIVMQGAKILDTEMQKDMEADSRFAGSVEQSAPNSPLQT